MLNSEFPEEEHEDVREVVFGPASEKGMSREEYAQIERGQERERLEVIFSTVK